MNNKLKFKKAIKMRNSSGERISLTFLENGILTFNKERK